MATKRIRVKRQLAPLPVTTARNAYELLRDVRKAILAEPRRYSQGTWGTLGKANIARRLGKVDNKPIGAPACGTLACVAGWVVALGAPEKFVQTANAAWDGPRAPMAELARTLIDPESFLYSEIDSLFSGGAIDELLERDAERRGCEWSGYIPPTGTLAYAKLGARHIKQFMDAHKDQLKATLLKRA